MDFKLIAKVDEALVFEVGEGLYVTVYYEEDENGNEIRSRVMDDTHWTNPLGRFAWSYTKCSSDPKEDKCIEVIEKNMDRVLKKLNRVQEIYDEHPEAKEEAIEISNEFLDGMQDGETRVVE